MKGAISPPVSSVLRGDICDLENQKEGQRNLLYPQFLHQKAQGAENQQIPEEVESNRGLECNHSGVESVFAANFETTGHGEKRDSCGIFFTKGCLEIYHHREILEIPRGLNLQINLNGKPLNFMGYFRRFKHRCMRQVCPVCWRDWATRETRRASRRIHAFKLKGRNLRPIHVVVSISHQDYGLNLQELRVKVYKALKTVHLLGGMSIYHPKRWNEAGPYFSPHFHILGYGWLTDIRKQYIASGYVVKNLRIRKTVGGTIWYQLSHAGVHQSKHTITWFGCLSYNKLKVPEEEEGKNHRCPFCQAKLKQIIWVGDGSCNLPDEVGYQGYGDAQGWVYADVLRRAGGGSYYG